MEGIKKSHFSAFTDYWITELRYFTESYIKKNICFVFVFFAQWKFRFTYAPVADLSSPSLRSRAGTSRAGCCVNNISREISKRRVCLLSTRTTVTFYWIHSRMSLWVDKYRPSSLGKLDFHKEQAAQLKNLVREISSSMMAVYSDWR